MRVAVHFPAEHPLSGGEDAVAAYKLGRIEDGVHNAPVGHEPVPIDDFVTRLVKQAQAEYPDAEVVVERLIDNGDDTSQWIPAEDFDPDVHTPVGAGVTVNRELAGSLSATTQPDEPDPESDEPTGAGISLQPPISAAPAAPAQQASPTQPGTAV